MADGVLSATARRCPIEFALAGLDGPARAEAHEVVEAGDGAAGLRLARECAPSLVLCDVMMPETDGQAAFAGTHPARGGGAALGGSGQRATPPSA